MTQIEFKPDFGIRIRELRHREGDMSLRELARRVGISPSYLSQIEQGKLPPPSNIFLITHLAQELNENSIDLARFARRPNHSLSDLIIKHPEIPSLIAETLIELKQKSINEAVVLHCLQMLIAEEYGKLLGKTEDKEVAAFTDQVKKIHKCLRDRQRIQ